MQAVIGVGAERTRAVRRGRVIVPRVRTATRAARGDLSRRTALAGLAALTLACRDRRGASGPPPTARAAAASPADAAPAERASKGPRTARGGPLPVFYDARQHTDANESFSPSAGKPAQVMASWQRLGVPLQVMPVTPATPELIARAHDRAYVDGVLGLTLPNGFGNKVKAVAETLPWTVGSFVSAAVWVAEHKGVAVSPTSGFHHARHGRGGGFCTFNGLMVAVRALQDRGLARRIGILDCDVHYGDGTDDILRRLDIKDVRHWTFGAEFSGLADGERFLKLLPGVLEGFENCEVVLYQAGADPFIDDPLGGVLTAAELQRRDELVFEYFAAAGIPIAWNLAGGYTRDAAGTIRPVLDIHDATLRACHAAYAGAARPA